MSTSNGAQILKSAASPDEMQNEDSLGNTEKTRPSEFVPKYCSGDLLDQIWNFLQPGSTLKKSHVGEGIYKHFYRHSDELLAIRDMLGPPGVEQNCTEISIGKRSNVQDVIRVSEYPKPLVYFVSELWGLDFSKGEEKENTNADLFPEQLVVLDTEVVYEGHEAISRLREGLLGAAKEERALTEVEIMELVSALDDGTCATIGFARDYLESMLLIGAAIIYIRLQRSLLDKERFKKLRESVYTVLKARLRTGSVAGLEAKAGRISRAYRHAMSVHLNVQEPDLSDRAGLWEFYQKSLPEIPKLVDRYIGGGFDYRKLNGIPFLPRIGDAKKAAAEEKAEKPDWHKHVKNMKAIFNASESNSMGSFLRKNEKNISALVGSTLYSLAKMSEFYSALGACKLGDQKHDIQIMLENIRGIMDDENSSRT